MAHLHDGCSESQEKVWVVDKIVVKTKGVESELNKMKVFDGFDAYDESQTFKRELEGKYFSIGGEILGVGIRVNVVYGGTVNKGMELELPDFLLQLLFLRDRKPTLSKIGQLSLFIDSFGDEWLGAAQETIYTLDKVLGIAKKIRRNILYPEIVEMEKELALLHKRHVEDTENLNEQVRRLGELETAVEQAIIETFCKIRIC